MSRRKLGIVPKKSDGGEEGEEILNGGRKISEEFEEQGEIILLIVSLCIFWASLRTVILWYVSHWCVLKYLKAQFWNENWHILCACCPKTRDWWLKRNIRVKSWHMLEIKNNWSDREPNWNNDKCTWTLYCTKRWRLIRRKDISRNNNQCSITLISNQSFLVSFTKPWLICLQGSLFTCLVLTLC